jgi:hypothetical protein
VYSHFIDTARNKQSEQDIKSKQAMGGDGGTKAVTRAYLRGAGAASTSGDAARQRRPAAAGGTSSSGGDPVVRHREAVHALTHCALTDRPLFVAAAAAAAAPRDAKSAPTTGSHCSTNNYKAQEEAIVVCPYGFLYRKEAAVEALLLRRTKKKKTKKNQQEAAASVEIDNNTDDLGSNRGPILPSHIRGLKDLHDVTFQVTDGTLVCPVTGRELLNGQIKAYALIINPSNHPGRGSSSSADATGGGGCGANVVSEYAIQQLGEDAIYREYAATDRIRLIPPPDVLDEMRHKVAEQRAAEEEEEEQTAAAAAGASNKKKRKTKKKNHHHDKSKRMKEAVDVK